MVRDITAAALGALCLVLAACGNDGSDSRRCDEPLAACGGGCVDLQADPAHCGACGEACAGGWSCHQGSCTEACPAGTESCDGSCVDTRSDAEHCGACGHACDDGAACESGACGCPAAREACAGTCVDLTSDPAHCGACGNACAGGAGCDAGECVCPGGQEDCSGACADPQTDPNHCGGCGNVCTGGTVCEAGGCVCPPDRIECGGNCVDPGTDAANCGGCGLACGGNAVCRAGACAAAPCERGVGLPGPSRVDTGAPYGGLATGDLDGDGDPDVVTADEQPQGEGEWAVRWLENRGGSFAAPVTIATSPVPLQDLRIADLDGEGPLDLAGVTQEYSPVVRLILRGASGAPRLVTVSWPRPPTPFIPRAPTTADLDADGDRDLVLSDGNYWGIRVAQNLGAGVFEVIEAPVPLPPDARPDGLAIGDMDGNGYDDLVVAEGHELYTVKTVGPFQFVVGEVYVNGSQHGEVALGDFDGDGDLDAVLDEGHLARNDGSGRFSDYGVLAPRQTLASRMATGDVDGNGHLDFVGPREGQLDVVLNQGTSFLIHARALGYGVDLPHLVDLDGDGRLDLLVANPGSRSFDVLPNPGDGRFPGAYRLRELMAEHPAIALGEIDSAGGAEVLVVRGDQARVYLVHPTPDGPLLEYGATPAVYAGVALLELDGDPQAELATTDPATGRVVFLQGWPPVVLGSVDIGPDLLAAVAADLDGDGTKELVTLEGGVMPGVRWLHADDLAVSPLLALAGGATPREALVADLDRDGDDDLVVASDQGLHVLRSAGGILADVEQYGVGARALAAGDLDGDGWIDLAVADRDEDRTLIYGGTGAGFAPRSTGAVAAARLAIADVDSDGRNEVIGLIEPDREVAILLESAGTVAATGRWPALFPWTFDAALLVEDLDGDRRPDAFAVDMYSAVYLPAVCLP